MLMGELLGQNVISSMDEKNRLVNNIAGKIIINYDINIIVYEEASALRGKLNLSTTLVLSLSVTGQKQGVQERTSDVKKNICKLLILKYIDILTKYFEYH